MTVAKNAICKLNSDFIQEKFCDSPNLNHKLSFDGVDFTSAASSNCNHQYTYGLANYKGF